MAALRKCNVVEKRRVHGAATQRSCNAILVDARRICPRDSSLALLLLLASTTTTRLLSLLLHSSSLSDRRTGFSLRGGRLLCLFHLDICIIKSRQQLSSPKLLLYSCRIRVRTYHARRASRVRQPCPSPTVPDSLSTFPPRPPCQSCISDMRHSLDRTS